MLYNKKVLKFVTVICSFLSIQVLAIDVEETKIKKAKKFKEWVSSSKVDKRNNLPDRVIVKYKDTAVLNDVTTSSVTFNSSSKMASKLNKRSKAKLAHVRKFKSKKHIFNVDRTQTDLSVAQVIAQLQTDPEVESVEEDPKRYLMSQTQPWGIPNVQADQLSDNASSNMTVCIIDSGYEQSNPDLADNNALGENNSGTGNWFENGGSHGTHVAGTIAGVNNTIGVEGILPNKQVNLFIVKVFNADGWGYSSDLSTAVDTCVDNGAKVINMSLGGASSSATERASMQAAADSGVLLIAASGNDGNDTLSYPASYDAVMSVGAVDETGLHAEFSQYTAQVEIAAPGEAVLSTVAGDGRLGSISVNGTTYAGDRVNSQSRYVSVNGSFNISHVNGSVTSTLGQCTLLNSGYSCTDVSGNICLVERDSNQTGSSYPEINGAKACTDAGAVGVIVYSNNERPGLQHPFLVDTDGDVDMPYVSINRALGLELSSNVGDQVTLSVVGGQDYDFYNGTSMATPHVAGVAALVWSNNISCTADDVRQALKNTAIDLESAGRDDKTGYGLVQAKAASDYLANGCGAGDDSTDGGTADNELVNGVAQTALSATSGSELLFTMNVPANATELDFSMTGGTGDADLYVKFGSEPTLNSYDCRPYVGGNEESCSISPAQSGVYYVKLVAFSTFSGVSVTGSYTDEDNNNDTATGATIVESNLSASRNSWIYYSVDVPAGMSVLNIDTLGGTGDADLYVRFGNTPTTTLYDCRPYVNGNTESCNIENPSAGTWEIGIRAFSAFSGLTLTTTYEP